MQKIVIFFICFIMSLYAKSNNPNGFIEGDMFEKSWQNISDLFTSSPLQEFEGKKFNNKRITIRYKIFEVEKELEKAAVVISSGRTECMLKYQEIIYELYIRGYSVYIMDHRGQGFSDRMLENKQKGYVEKFNNYINDFKKFTKIVFSVRKDRNKKVFLLSHSMGGAIVSRYLEKNPENGFSGAVLSSPMHGLRLTESQCFFKKGLEEFGTSIVIAAQALGSPTEYIKGGGDYEEISFSSEKNIYTHDQQRFEKFFNAVFNTIPAGSATWKWVDESIIVCEKILFDVYKIKTPILLLQASDDELVDNQSQDFFKESLDVDHQFVRIEGAYHGIFYEKDEQRIQALNCIFNFFEKYYD